MKVKAEGRLRHCFFGTYSAVVALSFADKASMEDAQRVLGPEWKPSERGTPALIASLYSEALDAFKARFAPKSRPCGHDHCSHGCRDVEIDNVNHSIDYGPPFDVTFETTPGEQEGLFG